MDKKITIFTVLILLILLSASQIAAEKTVVLNAWVSSEHNFVSEGVEFDIYAPEAYNYDNGSNTLYVSAAGKTVAVNYQDCETSTIYKYCYENASNKETGVGVDSNRKIQPAIKVLIEYEFIEDKLLATKTYSAQEINIGEEIIVGITVFPNSQEEPETKTIGVSSLGVNRTSTTIFRNIILNEQIPEYFSVKNAQGLTVGDNSIYAEFELETNESWYGTYTIVGDKKGTDTTSTLINYESGPYIEQLLRSQAVNLTVLSGEENVTVEVSENKTFEENKTYEVIEINTTETVELSKSDEESVEDNTTNIEEETTELNAQETVTEPENKSDEMDEEEVEEEPKGFFAKLAALFNEIF
jgi:hypothetical protein